MQRRWSSVAIARASSILEDVKAYTKAHDLVVFQSTTTNPYHNLAIENYLLKHSDPASKIFFSYINRPCVVFGRNQNPWLECNLAEIQKNEFDLVRRRSGGGTVIHDAGNLNFSFIVPNDKEFTRDKHGELVVEAVQEVKHDKTAPQALFESLRVNERHDIVMRRSDNVQDQQEYKVSGSAYKLTKGRALHHGTLLLGSPNVGRPRAGPSIFSTLLGSPASLCFEAKGVGSVRSPVHNLYEITDLTALSEHVRELTRCMALRFCVMYDYGVEQMTGTVLKTVDVGDAQCDQENHKDIYKDVQELMSDSWRYCQTPSFEYTSPDFDGRALQITVRSGEIISTQVSRSETQADGGSLEFLHGQKLHEIRDWKSALTHAAGFGSGMLDHLSEIFPPMNPSSVQSSEYEKAPIVSAKRVSDSNATIAVKRKSKGQAEEREIRGNTVIDTK